jgi:putative ABC transport system substrate-binding protein
VRRTIAITLVLLMLAALALAPRRSHAQAPGKVHRVANVSPSTATVEAFRRIALPELATLGFVEGRNLALTSHVGPPARMPELAREALASRPDVVVATSLVAILAVKAGSSSVPIVMAFIGEDPVVAGLAQSFARPGGNTTGIAMLAAQLDGKRASLLHEAVPFARRIAILAGRPPRNVQGVEEALRVAGLLGLEAHAFHADEPADYAAAFDGMRAARAEALLILSSPDLLRDAADLSRRALEIGLPTMCEWASMARDGCLVGYGPNYVALWRRSAHYVASILRRTPAGELPIEQPTVFELAVNLKTARQLGITLPPSILARADEVIE